MLTERKKMLSNIEPIQILVLLVAILVAIAMATFGMLFGLFLNLVTG
jgi:hypothetical protein